ncbi:tetratricopeptide repeat protein [Bradyrhizobium sp. B117]|uniref:tetratricopeptide repeat protein n=1 Tax=Bradyrhizobium sp. B117 TaxID=3140246 RepID=UPI003183CBF2
MPKANKPSQIRAVLLLALTCFAGSSGSIQADTDAAVRALRSGDYTTAMPLLKDAAGSGDAYAQVLLAQLLLNGKSGITDPEQAAKWYRAAAVQDTKSSKYVAIAQSNLASLYWTGRGVPKDAATAIELYRQAASNGDSNARNVLIGIYYRGDSVPKDIVQAFKWASIDFASGNIRIKPMVDALAREMTLEQRLLALRQAHEEFPGLKLSNVDAVAPASNPQLEATKGVPTGPAGLTKEFEALHRRPLNDEQIVGQLKSQLRSLSPPFIFELARRTFALDKQDAMTFFWLARLRAYYDATRCTDATAGQGIAAWDFVVQDIIRYGQQNPGKAGGPRARVVVPTRHIA